MGKRPLKDIAPQGCGVILKSRGKTGGFITKIIAENGEMLMTSKQVLNDKATAVQNLFQTRNAMMGVYDGSPMVVVDLSVKPSEVCTAYPSGTLSVMEEFSAKKPKKK
jgi:hypothetical protein